LRWDREKRVVRGKKSNVTTDRTAPRASTGTSAREKECIRELSGKSSLEMAAVRPAFHDEDFFTWRERSAAYGKENQGGQEE